jgi:hypothetical protein
VYDSILAFDDSVVALSFAPQLSYDLIFQTQLLLYKLKLTLSTAACC